MSENLPVISSGELAIIRDSLDQGKISNAMNHFRMVTLNAPLPVLFHVYTELKNEMTMSDENSRKNFNVFNDLFLRMLEERGETTTETYKTLLRDSTEYTYLNGLFSSKIPRDRLEKPKRIKEAVIIESKPEIVTLKKILARKEQSLLEISIDRWYDLVNGHLDEVADEALFVKKSLQIVNYVYRNPKKESRHLELVIVYTFERLLEYKELSTRSKDFAMHAMNLMTAREPLWTKLHKQYLEIIRK